MGRVTFTFWPMNPKQSPHSRVIEIEKRVYPKNTTQTNNMAQDCSHSRSSVVAAAVTCFTKCVSNNFLERKMKDSSMAPIHGSAPIADRRPDTTDVAPACPHLAQQDFPGPQHHGPAFPQGQELPQQTDLLFVDVHDDGDLLEPGNVKP